MTAFLTWLRSILAAVLNGIAKFVFLLILVFRGAAGDRPGAGRRAARQHGADAGSAPIDAGFRAATRLFR